MSAPIYECSFQDNDSLQVQKVLLPALTAADAKVQAEVLQQSRGLKSRLVSIVPYQEGGTLICPHCHKAARLEGVQ